LCPVWKIAHGVTARCTDLGYLASPAACRDTRVVLS
jgi:hypothetical protein